MEDIKEKESSKTSKKKKIKKIKLKTYKLPKIETEKEASLNANSYQKFKTNFAENKTNIAVASSIANVGIKEASFNNDVLREDRFIFSNETKIGEITSQKASGRCWLFAALNAARVSIMKTLNLDDFELSQNYLCFYEKMEKANAYLENIIATLNYDVYSQDFTYVKGVVAEDGGFYEWYRDLVIKYGVVPKSCMPETYSSSNTDDLVDALNERLMRTAMQMRNAYNSRYKMGTLPEKDFIDEMRNKKEACLNEVYNICVKALGNPPQEVNYAYCDKDKKKQSINNLTPKEFYEKYCGLPLEDMVVLTNDPTQRYPDGTLVTYKYSKVVCEGEGLMQLLAPMKELSEAAIKSIKKGEPLWFACDVSKSSHTKKGLLDDKTYLTDLTLTEVGSFSKKDRAIIGETELNHAMLICGVDLDKNGQPKKWKVENSWGEDVGQKGIFTMSHQWFLNNTFQVIVNKKYVSKEILAGLKKKPVVLSPWQMICKPLK